MAAVLQSASRDALAAAGEQLDAHVDNGSAGDLATLGDDLFSVLRLLTGEIGLRRSLADPATPAEGRAGLAQRLFSGKISQGAMEVLDDLASSRWSRPSDLSEALEVLARRATLGVAEKDGTLDDVEDQLFRFGRILDREPELGTALAEQAVPADKRVALLHSVLDGKVSRVTETLLEQAVRTPRGRHLVVAAEELSELAAARRDRYVAHVSTPVRLTAEQEKRLIDTMTRLYDRPISLQVELDPALLGGLVVRVGDELIDGSISGKLAAARRRLPG